MGSRPVRLAIRRDRLERRARSWADRPSGTCCASAERRGSASSAEPRRRLGEDRAPHLGRRASCARAPRTAARRAPCRSGRRGTGGWSGARSACRRAGRRPADRSARPRARASARASSSSRQSFGAASTWSIANVIGRPVSARGGASSRARPSGVASSPAAPAPASSNTPRPSSPSARAEAEQLVLGGERAGHRLARDRAVRDRARGGEAERARGDALAHERAPSRAMSSGVRRLVRSRRARPSRRRAPRRAAPACRCPSRSGAARARRDTRGRSPTPTSMPSCSAVPGMSSTPSISSIRKSCSAGRTGAKPTPQLPITPW